MDQLNMTSSNFTNISTLEHPPPPSFPRDPKVLAAAVLMSLCFLVGFPGNLVVIIRKPNWQNMSRLTQSLLLNLALSDLLCLVTLPIWIYTLLFGWPLGTAGCKIVSYFVNCSIYSSLLTVTALSVQRYVQVKREHRSLQFKKRLLVLLWLTSMTLSIPALVFRQNINSTCWSIYTTETQQVAVLLTVCFVGFSAFIITTSAYILLNRKLNQAVLFNNVSTSRLLTSIIVTFFVLWMPFFIFKLVTVGGILMKNLRIVHFYDVNFNIFASTIFINSCTNPLLYGFAAGMCCKIAKLSRNNREITPPTSISPT